jgi:hypothetical protein
VTAATTEVCQDQRGSSRKMFTCRTAVGPVDGALDGALGLRRRKGAVEELRFGAVGDVEDEGQSRVFRAGIKPAGVEWLNEIPR